MIQVYSPPRIFQARIVLTDDLIKALPSTGVVVADAPGVGKINILLRAILQTNIAVAYGNVTSSNDPSDAGIFITTSLSDNEPASNYANPAGLLSLPSISILTGNAQDADPGTNANLTNWQDRLSPVLNEPLVVIAYNDDGDYTEGSAANNMIVNVAYLIFNTITGLFETEIS